MADKVLILLWQGSAYDSLRGLLLLAAAELAAAGFKTEEFLIGSPGWEPRLVQTINAGGIACAFGMSGLGCDLIANDGRNLWDAVRVPFFNWNCDHPCYYPARHAISSPYVLHGYVFPDHARYAMQHFNPNGTAYAVHLAMPTQELFTRQAPTAQARNGRIMFTKSGGDTNKTLQEWRGMEGMLGRILCEAAEELIGRSTGDFLPVLQRIAEPYGMHLQGDGAMALFLIQHLDRYIRFERANRVVKAASRFPVDIFGTGWEHIDPGNGPARFHGGLNWLEIMTQLPHYLGCLSVNPLTEESVHDRVFFALAANVVPVSNRNHFSRTEMPELADYSFDIDADSVAAALDALLTEPDRALAQTETTRQALYPRYTLGHSVQQLVSFCQLVKLNGRITGAPSVADK